MAQAVETREQSQSGARGVTDRARRTDGQPGGLARTADLGDWPEPRRSLRCLCREKNMRHRLAPEPDTELRAWETCTGTLALNNL
ncbi:hypothetical protein J6590_029183 [Homalodisca vitripennis]|nr:hypothetical protein J6590_029183 [Homalodisca vitripennis]